MLLPFNQLSLEQLDRERVAHVLGLDNPKHVKIYFKNGKVTSNCRVHGHTFGSRGTTLGECLIDLKARIESYEPPR